MSKGRTGVSVVLGVPTVRRQKQDYLMETLHSLVEGMTTEEAEDAVLVVFIAEVSRLLVITIRINCLIINVCTKPVQQINVTRKKQLP